MTHLEMQHLLGRDEVDIDLEEVAACLTGRTVLVTGAGGSIGSELCRQIAALRPRSLVLLGRGENSLYEIAMELRTRFPKLMAPPVVADIRDRDRIQKVFEEQRPEVVFHTAAHKHVDLMEMFPEEAVKNNVFGTQNVLEAAAGAGVGRFVMISTDKAVNPACVYGAAKRVAELLVASWAQRSETVFVTVRFGNVLGSRGSIVPLFRKQIELGGPVTVTHPEARRYFMTLPEAVRLVLQSGAFGSSGETFVLDMGEQVRILDLATSMIRLAGLEPGIDIKIEFIGLRPGDKLSEELLTHGEGVRATRHKKIFAATPDRVDNKGLERDLEALKALSQGSDRVGLVRKLREMVPTYQPSCLWEKAVDRLEGWKVQGSRRENVEL